MDGDEESADETAEQDEESVSDWEAELDQWAERYAELESRNELLTGELERASARIRELEPGTADRSSGTDEGISAEPVSVTVTDTIIEEPPEDTHPLWRKWFR